MQSEKLKGHIDGNSSGAGRPPAVLTDFDDTAAVQNVAELLLNQFGDPTWQELRRQFRAGQLTLMGYQEVTFRNIQADRAEMQAYVKEHATLRPHFKELWDHCQTHQVPLAIVSHGLDFYIEALLEKEGLPQIPVYAVHTSFASQGITYEYRYACPGQEHLGNSKALVVEWFQQQGYHVTYVGDGRSDFPPASKADLVFAHSVLAEECGRQQVPFHQFRDFGDVLLALRDYEGNGHRREARP